MKTSNELLPVCAVCKKIRDNQGCWRKVEQYVLVHSQQILTHGICPDCLQQFYSRFIQESCGQAPLKTADDPQKKSASPFP